MSTAEKTPEQRAAETLDAVLNFHSLLNAVECAREQSDADAKQVEALAEVGSGHVRHTNLRAMLLKAQGSAEVLAARCAAAHAGLRRVVGETV